MGGGGGGGMMHGPMGGNNGPTSQGYILPFYVIDIAVKKDFLKSKNLSVTLNASDILKTKINRTYTSNAYFSQTTERRRDQLFFRLNVSYRFGKFDASLFKRKNTKVNTEGMDMGM